MALVVAEPRGAAPPGVVDRLRCAQWGWHGAPGSKAPSRAAPRPAAAGRGPAWQRRKPLGGRALFIGSFGLCLQRCKAGQRKARLARGATASGAGDLAGRVGVHALVWVGGLTEDEVRFAAAGTAEAGYDILEIPLLDPASVDPPMIKRVLQEHGLVAATSMGLPFDADISSEDPEVVLRGKQRLATALDLAAAFDARHMCGILYSAFGKYKAPPTAAGRANSVEAIRELGRNAEERGVQVNLEVVNRYETNLLNTAEQAAAFCEDVNDPNVMIHLDTYHMNIEESSLAGAVRAAGPRLGYVHIGESHRGFLGTGTVAWEEFFGALSETGYKGPLTFESFSNKVVAPYCIDALCVWRNLWEDSAELATSARRFIGRSWETAAQK